jgi:pantothenate kinase
LAQAPQQALSLSPDAALRLLVERARALPRDRRVVIGLAGGPGVGKSTLATRLVAALGPEAAYVPMDGFHRRHAELVALGTVADKGMPHTFDGAAFVRFLGTLRTAAADMAGPGYSRQIEDVVENAFVTSADARFLVVEGNYLLLAEAPWDGVRPLLDLAVFIDVPREMVRERLLRRHAEHGLFTQLRNQQHVERVDLANYDRVSHSRPRADLAIDLVTDA